MRFGALLTALTLLPMFIYANTNETGLSEPIEKAADPILEEESPPTEEPVSVEETMNPLGKNEEEPEVIQDQTQIESNVTEVNDEPTETVNSLPKNDETEEQGSTVKQNDNPKEDLIKKQAESKESRIVFVRFLNRDNDKNLTWLEQSLPDSIDIYLQDSFVYQGLIFDGDHKLPEEEICKLTNCDAVMCGEFYIDEKKNKVVIQPHVFYRFTEDVEHLSPIESQLNAQLFLSLGKTATEFSNSLKAISKKNEELMLSQLSAAERERYFKELAASGKFILYRTLNIVNNFEVLLEVFGASIYYSGRLGWIAPFWGLGFEIGATYVPAANRNLTVFNYNGSLTWRYEQWITGVGAGYHQIESNSTDEYYSQSINQLFSHAFIGYNYALTKKIFIRPAAYILYSNNVLGWFGIAAGYKL